MRKGIKAKDIRDFEKICIRLNNLMCRIHEYQPNALLYVAGESSTIFHLTVGLDDADSMKDRSETSVVGVDVAYSDCGGW